jgi:hypothetical protein
MGRDYHAKRKSGASAAVTDYALVMQWSGRGDWI